MYDYYTKSADQNHEGRAHEADRTPSAGAGDVNCESEEPLVRDCAQADGWKSLQTLQNIKIHSRFLCPSVSVAEVSQGFDSLLSYRSWAHFSDPEAYPKND